MMDTPNLVRVEWENGDVTVERVVSVSLDCQRYNLDETLNGNYWAYVSMCTAVQPAEQCPAIRLGQIFTVEGKKYVIVRPTTDQQHADSNSHGQLVLTLFDL